MGAFLSYSILSGFLMLAMYLAYRLFMARENQHIFNRGVLLLIYFVSFSTIPAIALLGNLFSDSTLQTTISEDMDVVVITNSELSGPLWAIVLIWIFLSGMAVVTIKTAVTWFRLINVVRHGKKIERNGYTLVVTDDEKFAPFSWIRYVVISSKDFDGCCTAVTIHELKHISSYHWIDLLVAQVVCIINWFNPAAWLMRDELMLVHEFQADMAVIGSGYDIREYQMLLIKKAVGARFPSLANSLNHSKLKKRITMMYREKSCAGRKFKALALVPVLALALGVAAVPSVRAAVSTISSSSVSVGKGSENAPEDKITVKYFKVTNLNSDGNETTVVIKGSGLGKTLTVSGGTFTNRGKTYHAKAMSCNMTDGAATITVSFPFSSEYKNPKMTLMINGEEVPFNLENFSDKAHSIELRKDTCSSSPAKYSIVTNGSNESASGEMEIYFDGKKIDAVDLNSIPANDIASVTVDAQGHAIRITSKK